MEILIIEDYLPLSKLHSMILSEKGHEITNTTTCDYRDALTCDGKLYDVILYGIDFYRMDEVKNILQTISVLSPDTRIILTTISWYKSEMSAMPFENCELLFNPYSIDELFDVIEDRVAL